MAMAGDTFRAIFLAESQGLSAKARIPDLTCQVP
jgi:hypothetical protein